MSAETDIATVIAALAIPAGALVDIRVPKKLLVEQGAPTAADKRSIQDGIDELRWIAALKPNTIGVAAFSDEARDYPEIAVVTVEFRPGAKAARLIELIHRSIPYPVLLITAQDDGTVISVAHKRQAQNDAGKVVVERLIRSRPLLTATPSDSERDFLTSLALTRQPQQDMMSVYEGWVTRIEALAVADLLGVYTTTDELTTVEHRRAALDDHSRLA